MTDNHDARDGGSQVRQAVVNEIADVIADMDLTNSQRESAKAILRAVIRKMNDRTAALQKEDSSHVG